MSRPRSGAFGETPPAWMEALRDRAGPLFSVALAFAQRHDAVPYPEGRDGIRKLGKLVEAAAFDADLSDADDARFVEGAGAMLALLLLAHVGLGRHRERGGEHRLELGEFGFFDPFGAIDAALDAERPSAELSRRIAAAEAEAGAEGPVARTVRAFVRALAASGVDAKVRSRFGAHLELDDGIEVDLSRFVAAAEDESADLDGSITRLVALLAAQRSGPVVPPYAEVAERLLPRIAPARFFAELDTTSGGARLARRPFVDDLHLALVLLAEGRLRFAREDEATSWAEEGHDVYARAIAALDARAIDTRLRPIAIESVEGLRGTRPDGLAASLLLAPCVVTAFTRRLGPGFVVAIPHRDEIVAFPAEVDLPALAAHVDDVFRRAPHGISPALFRAAPDGSFASLDVPLTTRNR